MTRIVAQTVAKELEIAIEDIMPIMGILNFRGRSGEEQIHFSSGLLIFRGDFILKVAHTQINRGQDTCTSFPSPTLVRNTEICKERQVLESV